MRLDLLGLIEAAYRVDLAEEEWLAGVAKVGGKLFDRGLGAAAYVYEFGEAGPAITRVAFHGAFEPGWLPKFLVRMGEHAELIASAPTSWQNWLHLPVGTAKSIVGLEKMVAAFDAFGGARDVFAINGRDPRGFGLWFGVPQPKVARLTETQRELLGRVSTHLAAGYRVRRTLAGKLPGDHAEAVIDSNGKVVHAEGPAQSDLARGALRRAVAGLERARSANGRKDVDNATRAWRGLVDGRWSLLDQFESDGKRFVVATSNEVDIERNLKARPLSARERQVLAYAAMNRSNKEIAYALGISAATVRVLLARASEKLGVRGRVDAIAKFSSLSLTQ